MSYSNYQRGGLTFGDSTRTKMGLAHGNENPGSLYFEENKPTKSDMSSSSTANYENKESVQRILRDSFHSAKLLKITQNCLLQFIEVDTRIRRKLFTWKGKKTSMGKFRSSQRVEKLCQRLCLLFLYPLKLPQTIKCVACIVQKKGIVTLYLPSATRIVSGVSPIGSTNRIYKT